MSKGIVLDMDGTINKFYEVPHWLTMLRAECAAPYALAKPIENIDKINAMLATLQAFGYTVEIVSWLSKGKTSKQFNKSVRNNKRKWLKDNLPAIDNKNIHIVKYGTNKWSVAKNKGAILFDDEIDNCNEWNRNSNSGYSIHIDDNAKVYSVLKYLVMQELENECA